MSARSLSIPSLTSPGPHRLLRVSFLWPALGALLCLLAPACKQAEKTEKTAAPAAAQTETGDKAAEPAKAQATKPAKFIYVSPDPLGVNPFLLMGKQGIEAAAAKHGAAAKIYESEDPTTRRDNLRAAIDDGATLVAVLGFQFNDVLPEMAAKHPDVQFLLVDQCLDERPDNLHCAVFREYEPSFLLGAAAALLSKSGHVGVVCALDIPFMHRFTVGFAEGARHAKPDIKVDVRWVGGQNPFADPVRSKEQALALHAAGADVIFAASSGGDFGIFEAAADKGFHVMGVDVNHCPKAAGKMYDSALKHLDTAMVETIAKIMAGEKKVMGSYGLKEGGGSLVALDDARLKDSQCLVAQHPDVIERVRKLRDEIVAGTLTIEDPMFRSPPTK